MAETAEPSTSDAPWRGEQAPCAYCGKVISRDSKRCPHCRTSFSPAVRQTYREAVGDWFYLVGRNPSGRGVTFETLVKLVEKGRIRADSVVRGPTTHQDWMYAAEVPRLAKYLGICPHCFAQTSPDQTFCARCQLNMNERPASPRPGVPAELVMQPFHKKAHALEQELAKRSAAVQEARAERVPETPSPTPPIADLAATTGATAPESKSRIASLSAISPRRRPKIWAVLLLTWGTIVVLFALFLAVPMPTGCETLHGFQGRWRGVLGFGGGDGPGPSTHGNPPQEWLDERLRDADSAERAGDFQGAIAIYQEIADRTGDPRWQASIARLQDRVRQRRQDRLAELNAKLSEAEAMAANHQYDAALTVLRNIGPQDRELLASIPPSGVSVEKMEQTIRQARDRYLSAVRQQEAALRKALADAARLRRDDKLQEALDAYRRIAASFPRDLVAGQIDLDQVTRELQEAIEAGSTPPPEPVLTEKEIVRKVADLMSEAARLEEDEKFDEALEKLGAVKKFDQQYWPDSLEDRIKAVRKQKEALQFFGLDEDED